MPASARNGGRSSHLKFTPSCVSLRDALQFLSFSSPKQKRCQNFGRKNKVIKGDVGSKTICCNLVKRDALKFLSFFPCSMTQGVALGQVGFDFLNKQTEILSAF